MTRDARRVVRELPEVRPQNQCDEPIWASVAQSTARLLQLIGLGAEEIYASLHDGTFEFDRWQQ